MTKDQKLTKEEPEVVEEIPKEAEQKTNEQVIEELLASEEARKNSLSLALYVQNAVSKNWFTLDVFQKRLNINRQDAIQKLHILKIFDLVNVKSDEIRDGKSNPKPPLFKITVGIDQRLEVLDQVIGFYQGCMNRAIGDKNLLLKQQEKQNNHPS